MISSYWSIMLLLCLTQLSVGTDWATNTIDDPDVDLQWILYKRKFNKSYEDLATDKLRWP